MIEISGTCSSEVQSDTVVYIPDQPGHTMALSVLVGRHSAPGTPWHDASFTMIAHSDRLEDAGEQSGYFRNVHVNGDVTTGTFEADMEIGEIVTISGQWMFSGGSGELEGISGSGQFVAHMIVSESTSAMTWKGAYDILPNDET